MMIMSIEESLFNKEKDRIYLSSCLSCLYLIAYQRIKELSIVLRSSGKDRQGMALSYKCGSAQNVFAYRLEAFEI